MLNANHIYQIFKKDGYTTDESSPLLPSEFFDLAQQGIEAKFPQHIVNRKSFTINNVMISGYQVFDKNEVLQSLVVLNTSTSLKEKAIFKSTLYCLYNHAHDYSAAKVYGAYINKKYTSENDEDYLKIDKISKEVLDLMRHAFMANNKLTQMSPTVPDTNDLLAANVLPRPYKLDLKAFINNKSNCLISDIPSYLLNDKQRIIQNCHVNDKVFMDTDNLYNDLTTLCDLKGDIYSLDFEAAQFTVPFWEGIHPYDQVAFQYSLHKISNGKLTQTEYLELNNDPREALAKKLIKDIGTEGAILTFNARFERDVIKKLANIFPQLKDRLLAIVERLFDLHPLFKAYYYNKKQMGSWSLKALLPAVLGYNPYDDLEGTSNGVDAALTYHKVQAGEVNQKQAEIGLSKYCTLDTHALVLLFNFVIDEHAKL